MRIYTLETVVQDASGMQVSNRTSTNVHPEQIYIGLSADSWVGQVVPAWPSMYVWWIGRNDLPAFRI